MATKAKKKKPANAKTNTRPAAKKPSSKKGSTKTSKQPKKAKTKPNSLKAVFKKSIKVAAKTGRKAKTVSKKNLTAKKVTPKQPTKKTSPAKPVVKPKIQSQSKGKANSRIANPVNAKSAAPPVHKSKQNNKANREIKPAKKNIEKSISVTKVPGPPPVNRPSVKIASASSIASVPVKSSKPEPKGKFRIEYMVNASPAILFEFITTPSGLSEWFCDDVNIRDNVYAFLWDGNEQKARLVAKREPQYVRYQWLDRNDGSYFELRIEMDDLTRDVSLTVTDFAEDENDIETSKLLWESQIHKLLKVLGSAF